MSDELIPVTFQKIMQSEAYTVFMLNANDKDFPIYTSPKVGHIIQSLLSDKPSRRPYTHELLNNLLLGLDTKPLQVVIHDVSEAIYETRLFLERQGEMREIIEIDTRPSDALTLALMHNLPLFCKSEAFNKISS
ncbi:MAG: DUF151 domain-containing protein [Simkaniaceae bacterium]|nr:DUF151 domain-containing protein [Simkaniaceae bacterium]